METILAWYVAIGAISAMKRTYQLREELHYATKFAPGIVTILHFIGMVLHTTLWLPISIANAIETARNR